MVFVPDAAAPPGGRPLVAWAHPTLGMGDACAPSRSRHPLLDMTWLRGMLARGWAVACTDYAGLGTPGVSGYLVGAAEAHDVLDCVRAVRSMPDVDAGDRFALWGHSQGGHAVLFAAAAAAQALPDLRLVGAAAAAPAAELVPLMRQQHGKAVSWAIGPEIALAWSSVYPDLDIRGSLSPVARRHVDHLAALPVLRAGLEGELRQVALRERFFVGEPTEDPALLPLMRANTVPVPPAGLPVLVVQGLKDPVVLPNTTAAMARRFCEAGALLSVDWMAGVDHLRVAEKAGSRVTAWLADRFAGVAAAGGCDEPLPVEPAV